MAFDHRNQIRVILGAITATLDDNATAANILVMYQGGPEVLRNLFYVSGFHVVITIERPRRRESGDQRRIQDVPLRYNAEVPIHVIALDQTGATATKILNKIRLSMETVVEAAAQQTTYTLMIQQDGNQNQRIGGYDPLWRDDYILSYRPLES